MGQVFKGKIWVVEQEEQPDGRIFEVARRTPGVRILFTDDDKILLNKEKRHELAGSFDLRLPGGKVFDSVDDWLELDKNGNADDMLDAAKTAAANEAHEECGLFAKPEDMQLVKKDINGGKGEWDLYYFTCAAFEIDEDGPSYSDTESNEIEGWSWYSKEEALDLALDPVDGMSESRSARYVAAWAAK